jgi:hypothetical protein
MLSYEQRVDCIFYIEVTTALLHIYVLRGIIVTMLLSSKQTTHRRVMIRSTRGCIFDVAVITVALGIH